MLIQPSHLLSSPSSGVDSKSDAVELSEGKICKYCGKEFKPQRIYAKFCSRLCCWTFRNKAKGKPRLELDCPHCGKRFKQHNCQQMFCCRKCACAASNHREHNRENKRNRMAIDRKLFPEKYRRIRSKHNRKAHSALKAWLFSKLGSKCVRCGFSNVLALEIHHPKNDGKQHRQEFRNVKAYYKDCATSGRVELICANCHEIEHRLSKTRGGARKHT